MTLFEFYIVLIELIRDGSGLNFCKQDRRNLDDVIRRMLCCL